MYDLAVVKSGLKDKIDSNKVHIDFNINQGKYSPRDLAGIYRNIFEVGEYGLFTTKHGRQIFAFDFEEGIWKKSWVERGCKSVVKSWRDHISRNQPATKKTYENKYQMDFEDIPLESLKDDFFEANPLYYIDSTLEPHINARWKASRFQNYIFRGLKREAMLEFGSKHNIYFSDKKIKNVVLDYKAHPLYPYFEYILLKNKTVGYSQKIDSSLLWVDIDDDRDNQKFQKFMKLFNNPKLLYAEKSNYSGGWHLALKYNAPIKDEIRDDIEEYTLRHGLKIECCFYNKLLQLWCSIDYSPLKIYDYMFNHEFKFYNQLDLKDYRDALLDLGHRAYDKEDSIISYINDIETIKNISNGITPITYEKIKRKQSQIIEEPEEIKPEEEKINNWSIISDTKVQYTALSNKKELDYIYAEKGNKFPALLNNVFVALSKGITSNSEIRNILKQYQGTSKTIHKVPDSDIDVIKKYYYKKNPNELSNVLINTKSDAFVSSIDNIPNYLNDFLHKIEYNFVQAFLYNSKIHYKDKKQTRKHDLQIIAKTLLYEVVGKWIYNVSRKTNVLPSKDILDKLNNDSSLLTNITIPTIWVDKLLDYLMFEQSKENKITNHFKSKFIKEILVNTLNLIPSFVYKNMDNSKSLPVCNYFISNLPIQYKLGNYSNVNEFVQVLMNNTLNQFKTEKYYKTLNENKFKIKSKNENKLEFNLNEYKLNQERNETVKLVHDFLYNNLGIKFEDEINDKQQNTDQILSNKLNSLTNKNYGNLYDIIISSANNILNDHHIELNQINELKYISTINDKSNQYNKFINELFRVLHTAVQSCCSAASNTMYYVYTKFNHNNQTNNSSSQDDINSNIDPG